jgi:hypothetical protein
VLTAAVLGLATTILGILVSGVLDGSWETARAAAASLALPLVAAALLKLTLDAEIFLHLNARGLGELKRTAVLLVGELRKHSAARFGLGLLAVALALALTSSLAVSMGGTIALALASWALFLAGEGLERVLFFRAVSAPKMPGAVGP